MLCSGDHGVLERFIATGPGPVRLHAGAALGWETRGISTPTGFYNKAWGRRDNGAPQERFWGGPSVFHAIPGQRPSHLDSLGHRPRFEIPNVFRGPKGRPFVLIANSRPFRPFGCGGQSSRADWPGLSKRLGLWPESQLRGMRRKANLVCISLRPTGCLAQIRAPKSRQAAKSCPAGRTYRNPARFALRERLAKVYGPDGGMRSVDLVV